MKDLLISYASYQLWANEALLQVAVGLDAADQEREILSSFPSVKKTLLHMWGASNIWWQRLNMRLPVVPIRQDSQLPMEEITRELLEQDRRWCQWVTEAPLETMLSPLTYKTLKGDEHTQPVIDILLHLSNHGTYHRGQLVTMFRQLGVTKIPQTDYILYQRTK